VLLISFGGFSGPLSALPINLIWEEITMSWLRKIVSTVCSSRVEQVVEEVAEAMPTTQSLTAEPALASEPASEDENASGQRRYFVKRGVFFDPADQVVKSQSAKDMEEIPDKRPVDLKTLFPKLSLR
jgi:hypothetical protein